MPSLQDAAIIAVRDCMGAKAGESMLVIMDEGTHRIGRALFEAGRLLGLEAMVVEMLPRTRNGEEPPRGIAEIMKHVDIVLAPTSKSLSHTVAREEASKAGVRCATLPGISEECMARCLAADYHAVAARSRKYADILTRGSSVRITNADGTDLTLVLDGRSGEPDTGILREPGAFGNLPAGEAYIAPVEGKANGVFVADGAMAGQEYVGEKVRIRVENGYAVDISGGKAAEVLESIIAPLGLAARNIAELGIGTNERAVLTGSVLEDEKVMGTIHIAIGDNSHMGGIVSVPSHLDGIVLAPTVVIDGVTIMESGKFTD
jgi:leucyl aminopeptidase (aminopeptidase T)